MRLDAERVHAILLDCLFKEEETHDGKPPEDAVIVEGIMRRFGLNKQRAESHRSEIAGLLAELPDEFREGKGGGWSFLNGCMDRKGRQWGEQINVDELVVIGQAVGLAKYQMPRQMWSMLPGGVPYFSVNVSEEDAVTTQEVHG